MRKVSLLLVLAILPVTLIADDMAVTVYNSDLGVISETRKLEFKKGVNRLAFRDVPSRIDANSVRFDIAASGRNVTILEQNYAFDLVSPAKVYDRYIDKEIEMVDKEGRLYSGTLLSAASGSIILREKAGGIKIVLTDNITEVHFPSLPDGLITRPTLFWLYQSDFAGELESKVSYQTAGMTWNAEYVGVLNPDENQLSLSGWAAINNVSGKTYEDASLKLVAGDIHRVAKKRPPVPRSADMVMLESAAGAGFEEKAFFEYHLYTLPRRATVADKEVKQISLFDPARAAVEKKYLYKPDLDSKDVEVVIKLKNSTATGLGMPLPAGRVRMFKADEDGSLILLGEDEIEHTPKNEELSLAVGTAFDVVAEEKLVNQILVSKQVEDRLYEIELRNRKDEAVTVDVEKRLYGFWEILEADFEYMKKDAYTMAASVNVGAGQTAVMKYKVRFTGK
ncbi:MAG: DUF4139 domain-containing protein [candidate division Zixibacteria bacterium]|nr:DUF4139 domain-containing protein [candidate division Zixibacteria bacterium]